MKEETLEPSSTADEADNSGAEDVKKESTKSLFDKSIVDQVPVTLNAFLGESKMTVSELMELKDGSVISLNSSLNHQAELQLNGKTIGHGEVVAVGDKFGIRITEIGE